jgi:hypothetical protein
MLLGDIDRPAVILVHGVIFVGWMALLMAQVMFAAAGRIDLHRRISRYGITYGWLVLAIGLIVGPAASVIHIRAGEWKRDRGAGFLPTTSATWCCLAAASPRRSCIVRVRRFTST